MNELILREAKFDDRIQLDELFHEELEYHKRLMPNLFRIPEIVVDETWLKSIINSNNAFLVASDYNGILVGAILYKIETNPNDIIYKERKFGYIEELIVKELFRGKGIGKKLLDYALKDLKTRNIKEIELNIWENNIIGLRFFKRHEFKTIQRRMKFDF